MRIFDVTAAYLKGDFALTSSETVYARPPRGRRPKLGNRSVVWKLKVPLYGEADAAYVWHITFSTQLKKQGFSQSTFDPCYYWKFLDDGTRMDPRGTQCQTGDWSLTSTVWDSVPSPFSVAGTQCPVPIRSRPPARDPVPSLGRLAGTRCPVPPVPAQIGLKTSQIKPNSGLKRVKSLFRQAI